jgi:hypothetical protein
VKMEMNLRVVQNVGEYLSSRWTGGISGRTHIHGVSISYYVILMSDWTDSERTVHSSI